MKVYINILLLFFNFLFRGDISAQWQLLGKWPYGACNTVFTTEQHIFLGVGGTIIIYDNAFPDSPQKITTIETPDVVTSITKQNNYLYI